MKTESKKQISYREGIEAVQKLFNAGHNVCCAVLLDYLKRIYPEVSTQTLIEANTKIFQNRFKVINFILDIAKEGLYGKIPEPKHGFPLKPSARLNAW
jgi:hypothetical protein